MEVYMDGAVVVRTFPPSAKYPAQRYKAFCAEGSKQVQKLEVEDYQDTQDRVVRQLLKRHKMYGVWQKGRLPRSKDVVYVLIDCPPDHHGIIEIRR